MGMSNGSMDLWIYGWSIAGSKDRCFGKCFRDGGGNHCLHFVFGQHELVVDRHMSTLASHDVEQALLSLQLGCTLGMVSMNWGKGRKKNGFNEFWGG